MTELSSFTKFLQTVDLKKYRDRYLPIKIVEMDLPKPVQSIALLYQVYWTEKKFIDYDSFYERYAREKADILEEFRQKTGMCKDCFHKGLPARTYRTWASLITQIHAGYVAESVFGKGSVDMSEELDHHGADFQVKYKKAILNYQVKKETQSSEVRRKKISKNVIDGKFIDINYEVPNFNIIQNPRKKDGEFRKPYLDFMNSHKNDLEVLPNGFVIFTPFLFKQEKDSIDSRH